MTGQEKKSYIQPATNLPELTYVPLSDTFSNKRIPVDNWGDPLKELGLNPDEWQVVEMLFTIRPESVIGKLFTFTDGEMQLTDTTVSRAILLRQLKDNVTTGKYLYLLYSDAPEGFGDWTAYPIEQIQRDWPEGVMFPHGSLPRVIDDPANRILAVSVDDLIRERGGDNKYHGPRPKVVYPPTNLP